MIQRFSIARGRDVRPSNVGLALLERRHFIASGAGLLAVGATRTAAAGDAAVKWRLTSSFPKSRDLLFGAAERFAANLSDITAGRFQIVVSPAGEIAAGLQAIDAVQDGRADLCHTSANYFVGKDPAFSFGSGLAFGPNARQQAAWFAQGGGGALFNDFCKGLNLRAIACGSTGARMGGWFRREIKTAADLNGLKFRIGGIGAQILSRLGVSPQAIAGAEIYGALERGTIDAADWLNPYDDEKLGLNKVAPVYHYPGWWEGGAQLTLFVNLEKWNSLSPDFQAAFEAAANAAGSWLQQKYDAQNPAALIRLIKAGTQFRPFPHDVLKACWKAAQETHAELAASNDAFKAMYDSLVAFRADEYLWWQVAEYSYDTFMIRARTEG